MTSGRACTIVAPDSVGRARVLAESLAGPGGGYELTALALQSERRAPLGKQPFEVIELGDIGLDRETIHRMVMAHDPNVLACAFKPHLLMYLLDRGEPGLLYLDPSVQVYASLEPIFADIEACGVVLWPKTLRPVPDDGLEPSAQELVAGGALDGGAVGVGASASDFVAWWAAETGWEKALDPHDSIHPDEWLDSAPALWGASIARDPEDDVSYWNAHERSLAGDPPDSVMVGGSPLRFFQFRGFDPEHPYLLTTEVTDLARVQLGDDPAIRGLCADRARLLMVDHPESDGPVGTGFESTDNGLRIDEDIRRLWIADLAESLRTRRTPPPDPFVPGGGAVFEQWLNEPVAGSGAAPVTRYLHWIWRCRPDLQGAFGDPLGADAIRLFEWSQSSMDFKRDCQPRLVPRRTEADSAPVRSRPGYNLIGFLEAEFGLGEIARSVGAAVSAAGIPLATRSIRAWTEARQQARFLPAGDGHVPYGVNLLSIMANETLIMSRDPEMRWILEGRHNVGVWFWEVDRLSDATAEGLRLVDEVWVASDYMAGIFEASGAIPVHRYTIPVPIPTGPTHLTRADLGLPEGYLFGFVFDFLSVVRRKNPIGLVKAYVSSFGPDDGAVLVLKSVNADRRRGEWARLRDAVGDRTDVILLDGFMSQVELQAFFQHLDCYVSLHRSEGFGATMATAMAWAKPTIATGFSGNLDFMNDANSYLVPYDLIEVGRDAYPYPAEATWAEPDLEAAAALMRHVVDDRDEAATRGLIARYELARSHGIERSAAFFAQQFERIFFDG